MVKERGDSDNIAAVRAILNEVVSGVGWCCDDGSSRLSLSVSLPFSAEARRAGGSEHGPHQSPDLPQLS
jgi:hypothetical protein